MYAGGRRRTCIALGALLVLAGLRGTASAQIAGPGAPGPFVIDVRGATTAVPENAEFYPTLPLGTLVPARGFGLDVGAHVYLFDVGAARVGVGANLLQVKASASTPFGDSSTSSSSTSSSTSSSSSSGTSSSAGASALVPGTLTLDATVRLIAPQVSFNFGTADGWSYLSAGFGFASIATEAAGANAPAGDAARQETGSVGAINFGGGARWFLKRHLGVGFDIRFHRLASGTAGADTRTPRVMLFSAAAGFALK